ncbi:MAG TPA: hypothetical protein VH540_03245 [Ktedonobacterales bacterium]
MQLVEQHVIARQDSRFAAIDQAAFAAKNLYNAALYLVRQSFIFDHRYLGYRAVYHQMKRHEAYQALPAKVAQQVLRLLDKNWQSYFTACVAYREDPSKFVGRPKLPRYKHKTDGRQALLYTTQALATASLRRGQQSDHCCALARGRRHPHCGQESAVEAGSQHGQGEQPKVCADSPCPLY